MDKPNCYDCKHRGTIPGDAHSCCLHPATGCRGDLFIDLEVVFSGRVVKAARELDVTADEHGIRSGWFTWPANFDPVWLKTCKGYEKKA